MRGIWLGLSLGLAAAGCSTTATVHGLADLPNLPAASTGAVIPITLEAGVDPIISNSGCTVVLLRAGGVKTYDINVPPGSDVIFAELPEGLYAYKEIVCSHLHWDLTFQKWPHFQVFPGQISVLGGTRIYLSSAQSMTIGQSNREHNRTDTLSLIGRISAESRAHLVSGYTGKKIVATELEKEARWGHWEVDPKLSPEERSWPAFRSCYRGEGDIDALWLGQLNLEVVYDQGKFVSIESETGWNSFSDQFPKCVKEELEEFRPRAQTHLRYKIYL